MPPRHAYWTILVDEQPTAFSAALVEDLQPTFKRLKEKHPSARVVWFQNGKVCNSRVDAQEAMHARGEMGRRGDVKQHGHRSAGEGGRGDFRDRPREPRPDQAERRDPSGKLECRPKGEGAARPRPECRPKTSSSSRAPAFSRGKTESRPKPEWKPKRTFQPKAEGRPTREGGPVHRSAQREGGKPEWRPKGSSPFRAPGFSKGKT